MYIRENGSYSLSAVDCWSRLWWSEARGDGIVYGQGSVYTRAGAPGPEPNQLVKKTGLLYHLVKVVVALVTSLARETTRLTCVPLFRFDSTNNAREIRRASARCYTMQTNTSERVPCMKRNSCYRRTGGGNIQIANIRHVWIDWEKTDVRRSDRNIGDLAAPELRKEQALAGFLLQHNEEKGSPARIRRHGANGKNSGQHYT